MGACKERIEEFLGRDLSRWSGLPAGCREANVTSWFQFMDGSGVVRRGEQQVEYTFRVMSHPSFLQGVSFYFAEGSLSFIETEFWSFDRVECAATLEQLGTPEQSLNLHWRDSVVPSGLRMYPTKGIAVGVIPETQLIVTFTVFPPCSTEYFLARYENASLMREFRPPSSRT